APDAAGDLGVVDLVDRCKALAHLLRGLERDRQEKTILAMARLVDAFQDLLLRLRAEAAQRGELVRLRRGLQVIETADAERLVQDADLLQAEVGDAEELENAGREARAQFVEVRRLPAARQLFDDGGGGLADSGRCDESGGGDRVSDVAVLRAQRARRARRRAP